MKKILLAVAVVGMMCGRASAQSTLYWDGDGVGTQDGGVGTWSTANARWTTDEGSSYAAWVNANGDSAVFDDVAATVTVSGGVTVKDITFSPNPSAAYTLTGGTITFLAGSTITVNTTGTTNTTLTSVYTGPSQLTKMGAGRLELNASTNTLVGGYRINEGFINLAAANRLGTTAATIPVSVDADWFVFGGGGLTSSNGASQDLGNTRGITLAGKAWLGASGATNPVVISAPITGTGDIIVANSTTTAVNGGSASPLNSTFNSGGIWILSNTANDWTGDAQIGSGTLRLGASNVIPDTAVVHLTNSGVQFDLNTNTASETVKSISGTAGTIAIGGGSLTVANPAGETYSSLISATAAGKFTKNGAGALTLSGSNTGFNGEFIMNAGTLGIGSSNTFGNGADGTDASTFTYNGGVLSNNGSGGRTVPAGVSVNLNANVTADDSLFSGPGQILFNGAATINANRTFTVNGGANLAFANIVQSSAGLTLTKEGNGLLVLTTNNSSYTGDTTVNNGTLRFTNGAAGTYAGSFLVNGGANTGRLEVDGDGVIGSGSNTVTLAGGMLSTNANRSASFDNPVSVTADSAISTTSAATAANFDFGSNTPFTFANSGLTLTIRNDGADGSGDKLNVRLFGTGFNIANPIAIVTGSSSSTSTLASFNTSGLQTFSGVISGSGSFNRSASSAGTGAATKFTADNTFAGGVVINDGIVYASNTNSAGSATGTGAVTVNNGGTLGGAGYVSGAVNVNSGGKLAPGESIASLDVGTLTFDGTANFAYEINTSVGVAAGADLVNANTADVNGFGLNIDVDGTATLTVTDLVPSTNLAGTKFTLIAYAGNWNGGTFANLPDDTYFSLGANDWLINYNDTTAGDNFSAETLGGATYVTILTAVPEASSLLFGALACCAAGVVAGVRWVRRRKS